EDPPHQLFQSRPQSQNPRLRAFGGLTPQAWATTTLSYIREIDLIQTRSFFLKMAWPVGCAYAGGHLPERRPRPALCISYDTPSSELSRFSVPVAGREREPYDAPGAPAAQRFPGKMMWPSFGYLGRVLGRSLVILVHGLSAFSQGLQRLTDAHSRCEIEPFGLESVLVDDLAQSLEWKLVAAWNWRRERHINVHEPGAYKHLCMRKARGPIPSRFVSLIDSNVSRCAISKGRSPSSALAAELREISALSLAFGFYGALPFTPTRLMPADAPSRHAPVPPPLAGPPLHERYPLEALVPLPRLKRWAANWARLILRSGAWIPPLPGDRFASVPALLYRPPLFDFDSSCGFPGVTGTDLRGGETALYPKAGLWKGPLSPVDVDVINAVMSRFGRALYEAMPWQVLLALVTAALFWGWLDVAGMLALAWGGLGRIGELFAATRADLVLPADGQGTIDYVLLAIREPKTRNTAARHQTLKLDQPQLMRVVSLAFGRKHRAQFLWPFSPGTFRQRFAKLTEVLELGCFKDSGLRPLDLGSLRAGGATWLLHATESGELVRRRGRWLNAKVMEIYVQEVSSVLFLSKLQDRVARRIVDTMQLFPAMLSQAELYEQFGYPPSSWFSLSAVGRA
ncbi:unnamed protein product, partial [Symbiodinium sp. CCMP2456]